MNTFEKDCKSRFMLEEWTDFTVTFLLLFTHKVHINLKSLV